MTDVHGFEIGNMLVSKYCGIVSKISGLLPSRAWIFMRILNIRSWVRYLCRVHLMSTVIVECRLCMRIDQYVMKRQTSLGLCDMNVDIRVAIYVGNIYFFPRAVVLCWYMVTCRCLHNLILAVQMLVSSLLLPQTWIFRLLPNTWSRVRCLCWVHLMKAVIDRSVLCARVKQYANCILMFCLEPAAASNLNIQMAAELLVVGSMSVLSSSYECCDVDGCTYSSSAVGKVFVHVVVFFFLAWLLSCFPVLLCACFVIQSFSNWAIHR